MDNKLKAILIILKSTRDNTVTIENYLFIQLSHLLLTVIASFDGWEKIINKEIYKRNNMLTDIIKCRINIK